MSRFIERNVRAGVARWGALAFSCGALLAGAQSPYPGIGRTATPAEIAAWDIDVRPDFKGLPAGTGSVTLGQRVWDAKCATCHGTFGESNEVFTPIVGNTTAEDIRTGRVKALTEPVGRTTLMKLSSLATLWDYINRAMPWDRPKSLSADEVYAAVAYILYLGDIVPEDFVLSDRNIRDAERRLPNRNGKVIYQALWNVRGKGDVRNVACMKDCPVETRLASSLPDYARDAHGNLAAQQRVIGPSRGIDTHQPAATSAAPAPGSAESRLAAQYNCAACHRAEGRFVGPSFKDIAARYKGNAEAPALLAGRVKAGTGGTWGSIPMPPNPGVGEQDLATLVKWILAGAP